MLLTKLCNLRYGMLLRVQSSILLKVMRLLFILSAHIIKKTFRYKLTSVPLGLLVEFVGMFPSAALIYMNIIPPPPKSYLAIFFLVGFLTDGHCLVML